MDLDWLPLELRIIGLLLLAFVGGLLAIREIGETIEWFRDKAHQLRPFLSRLSRRHPVQSLVVFLVVGGLLGVTASGIAYLWARAAPAQSSPDEGRETNNQVQSEQALIAADPEARFIRDSILSLAYELRQVSGRQFRDECLLMPGEQLGSAEAVNDIETPRAQELESRCGRRS